MGMIVTVYRTAGPDCTNNGITSKVNKLCIVNVEGPFEPNDKAPAAKLVPMNFGFCKSLRVVAIDDIEGGQWTMNGGNVVSTTDGRWLDACKAYIPDHPGFVQVHDRIEA